MDFVNLRTVLKRFTSAFTLGRNKSDRVTRAFASAAFFLIISAFWHGNVKSCML